MATGFGEAGEWLSEAMSRFWAVRPVLQIPALGDVQHRASLESLPWESRKDQQRDTGPDGGSNL